MTSPALVVSGLGSVEPGFTRTIELLQAALTDYDIAAIDETSDDSWRVFFRTPSDRDRALSGLRADFPTLALQPLDVADEDWARRSQDNLRAVRVGNIIVAPPWDVPTTIVIQPSTGFGTGHHATTRLCLAALQRLELADKSALDVGTGSGVLAIAGSRLGAADVTGIDDDADAIHAAWENLSLNPGAQVSLIHGDFRHTKPSPADVVLANLTAGLLIASAEDLRRLVAANGRLILSGFMTHEESSVVAAFSAFSVEHRDAEDEWVCVTCK